MTVKLLPSAAILTVQWLKSQPDLAALHGGRVATKLNNVLPAIRVQRVGGSPPEVWRDEPLMQIECWAATEGPAEDLARTVVAVLPTVRSAGALAYTIESGPYFTTDDPSLSTNVRYILTVRLLTTT